MNFMERANDFFGDIKVLKDGLEQTGFITFGSPEKGNQTAVQIAQGQQGGQENDIIQRQDGTGLKGGLMGITSSSWFLPVALIISAVGIAFFIRRRK